MTDAPAKRRARRDAPPRAWQRMLSGRRLDLLDPSPLDIEIDDIAHGLARVARWNGQTVGPHIFSVAQHSLLVERIAAELEPSIGRAERLFMLLHDAPEYVIGDMISPFKAVIGDAYKSVENRILGAILLRFSLPPAPTPAMTKLAKQADRGAAFFEAVTLAGFTRREAERIFGRPAISPQALTEDITPAAIEETQARFLARFHEIDRG
ncbi:HD family hydrolase [Methylocystis parvus]|uniref:HD family hydrolase n=1 Tax=Methylocystis parvus TaxID=134 RepID=A0A6B8M4S7_9HYPH|nr:HD family hydrolase [Methylocystis parvus]QGM96343.1 HD family hydrolase [Methylocystis parvus]WBJ99818.1 HD family hydrolase [Methylocystis parvus OBBP]